MAVPHSLLGQLADYHLTLTRLPFAVASIDIYFGDHVIKPEP